MENNRRTEELSVKVNLLKSYAKEIRDDAKKQNEFLDTLKSTVDSAGLMVNKTVGRVLGIPATRQNSRNLCITVLVFVAIFIIYAIAQAFRS